MIVRALLVVAVLGIFSVEIARAGDETPPPQCQNIVPIGTSIIWKGCAGSGHLSKDPRGYGVALIAKKGVRTRIDNCMRIYKPDGTLIGSMYKYPYNLTSAYAWRSYSNYVRGCGGGETRTKIKNRSGGGPVYIRLREASKTCIRLSKVFQNINSTQRC